MTPLAIYPLRLRFTLTDSAPPRYYLGSAWRGALGHHLKRLICIFPRGRCDGCPLIASCAYITVFEPHAAGGDSRGISAPYTLYPLFSDGTLRLDLTLVGTRVAAHFPFILQALRQAGEGGVAGRLFRFEAMEGWSADGWRPCTGLPEAVETLPEPPARGVRIRLETPLRFKHDGHLITPQTLDFAIWLRALRRRMISLAEAWGDGEVMRRLCAVDAAGEWHSAELRWKEQGRYSSRQRTGMKTGGVVGVFSLDAAQMAAIWPLLWLGSLLHVGKMTTMGLGRYEMEVIEG